MAYATASAAQYSIVRVPKEKQSSLSTKHCSHIPASNLHRDIQRSNNYRPQDLGDGDSVVVLTAESTTPFVRALDASPTPPCPKGEPTVIRKTGQMSSSPSCVSTPAFGHRDLRRESDSTATGQSWSPPQHSFCVRTTASEARMPTVKTPDNSTRTPLAADRILTDCDIRAVAQVESQMKQMLDAPGTALSMQQAASAPALPPLAECLMKEAHASETVTADGPVVDMLSADLSGIKNRLLPELQEVSQPTVLQDRSIQADSFPGDAFLDHTSPEVLEAVKEIERVEQALHEERTRSARLMSMLNCRLAETELKYKRNTDQLASQLEETKVAYNRDVAELEDMVQRIVMENQLLKDEISELCMKKKRSKAKLSLSKKDSVSGSARQKSVPSSSSTTSSEGLQGGETPKTELPISPFTSLISVASCQEETEWSQKDSLSSRDMSESAEDLDSETKSE